MNIVNHIVPINLPWFKRLVTGLMENKTGLVEWAGGA